VGRPGRGRQKLLHLRSSVSRWDAINNYLVNTGDKLVLIDGRAAASTVPNTNARLLEHSPSAGYGRANRTMILFLTSISTTVGHSVTARKASLLFPPPPPPPLGRIRRCEAEVAFWRDPGLTSTVRKASSRLI